MVYLIQKQAKDETHVAQESDSDSAGYETVPESESVYTFENETFPNDIIFDSDLDFYETAPEKENERSDVNKNAAIDIFAATCDSKSEIDMQN